MGSWIWAGCCGGLLLDPWWWLALRSVSLMGRLVPEAAIWGTFSWSVIYSFPSWELHQFVTDQDHYKCKNPLLRFLRTVLQIFDFLSRGRFLHRKLTKTGEYATKNVVTYLFQVLISLTWFENHPIFLVRVCRTYKWMFKSNFADNTCRYFDYLPGGYAFIF